MLELFRKNHFINSLLLLVLAVVLRSATFITEVQSLYEGGSGYFSEEIVHFAYNYPVLSSIISIIILFFEATYINRMVIINKLSNSITLYPGLIFIILSSISPEFLILSDIQIARFFLILGVTYLNYSYRQRNSVKNVYNAGLWFGFSCILYPPMLILMIFFYIGFTTLRRFLSVESTRYLIGVITPMLLLAAYTVYTEDFYNFIDVQFSDGFGLIQNMGFERWGNIMAYGPLLLFVLFSIVGYTQYISKKIIPSQKMISIQFWLMAFIGIVALFTHNLSELHFLLLCFPLSIFLSESIILMKNQSIGELILWIIVILSFILHYQVFF